MVVVKPAYKIGIAVLRIGVSVINVLVPFDPRPGDPVQ